MNIYANIHTYFVSYPFVDIFPFSFCLEQSGCKHTHMRVRIKMVLNNAQMGRVGAYTNSIDFYARDVRIDRKYKYV